MRLHHEQTGNQCKTALPLRFPEFDQIWPSIRFAKSSVTPPVRGYRSRLLIAPFTNLTHRCSVRFTRVDVHPCRHELGPGGWMTHPANHHAMARLTVTLAAIGVDVWLTHTSLLIATSLPAADHGLAFCPAWSCAGAVSDRQ